MAPEVRMKNCFLPSSQNHIDLCAGINAKGGKVPDIFSPISPILDLQRSQP